MLEPMTPPPTMTMRSSGIRGAWRTWWGRPGLPRGDPAGWQPRFGPLVQVLLEGVERLGVEERRQYLDWGCGDLDHLLELKTLGACHRTDHRTGSATDWQDAGR